jgi:hypothetical protein
MAIAHAVRSSLAALCLILMPVTLLLACEVIPSPAAMGCSKAESNACRLVAAGFMIQGANQAIGEQFDRGVITQAEALKLRAVTKRATDALVLAREAVAIAAADRDTQLAALDAVLFELLQAQLAR